MGLVFGKWNEIFSVGFLLVYFFLYFLKWYLFCQVIGFLFIYLLDLDIHFGTKDCRKKEFRLISYFLLHIVFSSSRFLHF